MPRPPNEELAILERRKRVAARYVRGEPQWSIARAFEIDTRTIKRDLAAIRADWLASSLRDFDALKSEQLAKIDAVEEAAWHGWLKSQENAEIHHSRVEGAPGATTRQMSESTKKGQAGDPRFLATILKCVERRCAICGLDAERRLKVSGLIEYANLTDQQLADRITDAQRRIGLASGTAGEAPGAAGPVEPPAGTAGPGPPK